MTRRTLLPCRHRGCSALVREPGYCERHAGEAVGWKPDRERGNRHQRGYGAAWDRMRELILKRDRYVCQCEECRSTGRVLPATEVDHRIPKSEGGSDDPVNLCAINVDCHKRKTAKESGRARARRRVG
ncbi:HNH endonuclease [Bordetella avium]|uniref:Phage protein n=2 Tax=Bordetella avium TaxID=521 RepID=Q2L2B9_BORA1|nr:HNH endonuclease [Bordetella avium]AZY52228.1 HNH endonuclease [Bordetella avium]RIQ47794.1 HNH endonuclease [Bordetella avium]RIQ71036.1 HNH endonuclease [Bordetella avium]CAJ49070.1 phage protein [Bordetella avium 197N]